MLSALVFNLFTHTSVNLINAWIKWHTFSLTYYLHTELEVRLFLINRRINNSISKTCAGEQEKKKRPYLRIEAQILGNNCLKYIILWMWKLNSKIYYNIRWKCVFGDCQEAVG